ncbi:MAG: hypothetical protein P8I27_17735 [Pirellulaceae bacterium]|nr:hypothetical protein [Pirellulaceae bacterium]
MHGSLIQTFTMALLSCSIAVSEFQAQDLIPVSSRRIVGWSGQQESLPEPIQPQELESLSLIPMEIEPTPDYVGGPITARTIVQRYPDGKPQISRGVRQDPQGNFINHGLWKLTSSRGQVMAEGYFKDGLMDGTWQRWHAGDSEGLFGEAPFNQFNGPFLSVANFSQGKLNGSWSIFDRDRRKVFEMPYVNGKRNGRATWYFPTSMPMREVEFRKGRLHGQLTEYNRQNRRTRETVFDDGQELITRKDWYFKDQLRAEKSFLGPKTEFMEEDDWWNARPAGYETVGTELQHGRAQEWYASGQLRNAGQYREGRQTGSFMWWHENGQKQIEGQFTAGKKNGIWRWYHKNGRKAIEGEYAQGLEINGWTWWTEDGKVEDQRDFSRENLEGIESDLEGIESTESLDFGDEAVGEEEFPDLNIDTDT